MRAAMHMLVVVLLALATTGARADEREDADRAHLYFRSGMLHYDEGRYEDAAREMEAAYRLKPLPDLQYNLAQCYERLGRLDDAANAYAKYVAGKPDADDRELVEKRIANLRLRAAGKAVAPPPTEKVVLKEVVVYRDAPPPPGRGARIAAVSLGALAALALASGITFSVLAASDADAVTSGASRDDPMPFDGTALATQAAGHDAQTAAWVSFGVAALAAGGAVGLWLYGAKVDREAPKYTLAPTLAPTGAGFALAGSF